MLEKAPCGTERCNNIELILKIIGGRRTNASPSRSMKILRVKNRKWQKLLTGFFCTSTTTWDWKTFVGSWHWDQWCLFWMHCFSFSATRICQPKSLEKFNSVKNSFKVPKENQKKKAKILFHSPHRKLFSSISVSNETELTKCSVTISLMKLYKDFACFRQKNGMMPPDSSWIRRFLCQGN